MSERRREALLTAGVGLAAVAIQLPIFDRWLALLDEGYLLELADEVNRGKLLYRDVYVDAPLPGAVYAMAAWFRGAGTSVWSARPLAVALFARFAVPLSRVRRRSPAAGGARGLSLAARRVVGRSGFAPAALSAAGGALVVLPAFAAVWAAGLLGPLVEQAFVRPLALVSTFGYTHLPPLRPLLHQDGALRAQIGSYFPAILLTPRWDDVAAGWLYGEPPLWDLALKVVFYAPYLVWAAAALLWARGARRLLVLAYAAGFLVAFNPPRDWVHLMMVFPPTLVLGTALVAAASP